ncbi:MAG: DUF3368 domain-containing protein [Thermoflexibacter sp.]|nr:DUF3368 domain-containing protein [Thermoflexibacter sp.]
MPKIISNTSILIVLDNLSMLDVLGTLYPQVSIAPQVATEFGKPLPNWVQIEQADNLIYAQILQQKIGEGESATIALGLQNTEALLILDDLKARKIATRLGLSITGTLGILLLAKKQGLLKDIPQLVTELKKLQFRISEELENLLLN